MGETIRPGREADDARAYFASPFTAVQKLWTVQKVPPHSAKHVVLGVKELTRLDEPRGSVVSLRLQDGNFCSVIDDTARDS